MTSLARANSVGGIVSPSVFAVLRSRWVVQGNKAHRRYELKAIDGRPMLERNEVDRMSVWPPGTLDQGLQPWVLWLSRRSAINSIEVGGAVIRLGGPPPIPTFPWMPLLVPSPPYVRYASESGHREVHQLCCPWGPEC